jgi:hypothetical protein
MSRGRRFERGQALVEFALIMPLLFLLLIGITDLARGFYLKVEVAGTARAGVRSGIGGEAHDLGSALRNEPNSAIVNSTAVWGATGGGSTYGVCDQGSALQSCGDPNACSPTLTNWSGGRLACFAIRSCSTAARGGGLTGSLYSNCQAWGTRPAPGSGDGLQVHVVYRYVPAMPAGRAFGQGGAIYLTEDLVGIETY